MNNNTTKLRLRVVYNSKATNEHPWKVQEKGVFFWKTIKHCRSESSAASELRTIGEIRLRRKSGVVVEYTEQDHLAEKLKAINRPREEDKYDAAMAQGAATMAYSETDVKQTLKKLAGM